MNDEITREEYDQWRYRYPKSEAEWNEAFGTPTLAPTATPVPAQDDEDLGPYVAYDILRYGASGPAVTQMQQKLYEQGYLQYRSPNEPICTTYLNCDRGYFEGRRYPLTNRIAIGHNPERCNICYPEGRGAGIASEHCEVRLRTDGQVEIVDLGSMGGTFLENGRRLLSNVPTIIPNGGRFYLVSKDEMYRLDIKNMN